jgi:hypothetical protein
VGEACAELGWIQRHKGSEIQLEKSSGDIVCLDDETKLAQIVKCTDPATWLRQAHSTNVLIESTLIQSSRTCNGHHCIEGRFPSILALSGRVFLQPAIASTRCKSLFCTCQGWVLIGPDFIFQASRAERLNPSSASHWNMVEHSLTTMNLGIVGCSMSKELQAIKKMAPIVTLLVRSSSLKSTLAPVDFSRTVDFSSQMGRISNKHGARQNLCGALDQLG